MRDRRRVTLRDFPRKGYSVRSADLPDDVVNVARPSRYGNPYRIGDRHPAVILSTEDWTSMTRGDVIRLYRGWLAAQLARDPLFLEPLRGKRLACWCGDDEHGDPLPCHVDIILEQLDRSAVPS